MFGQILKIKLWNAASEKLQRKLDKILGNTPNGMVIADNATIFATSFDGMYDTLDKVLNRFLE